ncbi:hypothetical protein N5P32_10145 [Marinomonas pontica]|nr:hypothetical protein [Marinomonas pontica]MCW8356239.1 hypothetical protein [Marinomonas pontica]
MITSNTGDQTSIIRTLYLLTSQSPDSKTEIGAKKVNRQYQTE